MRALPVFMNFGFGLHLFVLFILRRIESALCDLDNFHLLSVFFCVNLLVNCQSMHMGCISAMRAM